MGRTDRVCICGTCSIMQYAFSEIQAEVKHIAQQV
jgi:hypothetical protein